MMSITNAQQQLGLLESQLKAVSGALLGADSKDVHSSSATLQKLAVDLLQLRNQGGLNGVDATHVALRLQALAQGMAIVRETLLRRSAYVDRALAVLVPQTQAQATYSDSSTPYGTAVRASGQFKGFAA
jgi:hypothetical protein